MKDRWKYAGLGQVSYGDPESYRAVAECLDWTGWTVEDWGCGCAFARRFFHHSKYVGVDGSQNNYADVCPVELSQRCSNTDGLLLRHVLEHNENWKAVLENAIRCCKRRLVIDLFIPFGPETKIIDRTTSSDTQYPDIPNIQFKRDDLIAELGMYRVRKFHTQLDIILVCDR